MSRRGASERSRRPHPSGHCGCPSGSAAGAGPQLPEGRRRRGLWGGVALEDRGRAARGGKPRAQSTLTRPSTSFSAWQTRPGQTAVGGGGSRQGVRGRCDSCPASGRPRWPSEPSAAGPGRGPPREQRGWRNPVWGEGAPTVSDLGAGARCPRGRSARSGPRGTEQLNRSSVDKCVV